MSDKRVCGVCTAKGHTSRECPRLNTITTDLRGIVPGPEPQDMSRITVTENRRGRPKSNGKSNAARQKAWRQRNK